MPDKTRNGSHLISQKIEFPDADILFYPDFFRPEESDVLFENLLNHIAWKQEQIKLFGKVFEQPRLTAWYGDGGKSYTYSGIKLLPNRWTPELLQIKERIEKALHDNFNSVLLNLYRDGQDGMSWHRDDEPDLGINPVIASVSFGAARRFQLKHKYRKELKKVDVDLTHGSLLVMAGTTQHFCLHKIVKSSKTISSRINLTFRKII